MNLEQLTHALHAGAVQSLDVLSIEGGYYVVHIQQSEQPPVPLRANDGKTLLLRSTTHVRNLLEELPDVPCFLVHHSVHDEMCGVRQEAVEPLRVPFTKQPTW